MAPVIILAFRVFVLGACEERPHNASTFEGGSSIPRSQHDGLGTSRNYLRDSIDRLCCPRLVAPETRHGQQPGSPCSSGSDDSKRRVSSGKLKVPANRRGRARAVIEGERRTRARPRRNYPGAAASLAMNRKESRRSGAPRSRCGSRKTPKRLALTATCREISQRRSVPASARLT